MRPTEDDSNKGFEIYMPGKDIGHIKIEYTCSLRILNTYREHMSGKDIRHTQEGDRLEQTRWGKDIWNGKNRRSKTNLRGKRPNKRDSSKDCQTMLDFKRLQTCKKYNIPQAKGGV